MPFRVIFMGTAELACPSLRALLLCPEIVVTTAVTQPDRPRGRDLRLQPSPVKKAALDAALPVLQPARARDNAFIDTLRELKPEIIVVAAYGQILPVEILELPRFGCVNVHASLLPKYRGAAPIQWAILDGEPETGVTIMKMAAGLDTGDILRLQSTSITDDDTAATLHDRLANLGAELLISTLMDYTRGNITPRPQIETASSYARKISKEDGRMDWSQPALTLWRRIRAFTPWPGAFTHSPQLLKIWHATVEKTERSGKPGEILAADRSGLLVACGEGSLRIEELQREGGKRLKTADFMAGHPLAPGCILV